tara:strand:- start:179 stop:427 length:249 start_codon:yes stop_codon:yes gene_type:complete
MDIAREQQGNPKRIKKNRVSKHEVPITESNKYKHWEIRAAVVGMFAHYVPQAKIDMEQGGLEAFWNHFVSEGSKLIPKPEKP